MSAEANHMLDRRVAELAGWQSAGLYNWYLPNGALVVDPHKSLDAADALLDRIAALGWAVTTFTSGWYGKTQIRCCIMRAPGGPAVDVVAETRPQAICRAFVQAMERWSDG